MAVAPDGDAGVGPMGANAADQAAQMATHLPPVRGLARAQDGCHAVAALSLIDMDRQKAALIIVRVEQRGWLMPVHHIERVIDVQRDSRAADALAHHRSTIAYPSRISARRSGAFSSRDSVGCEARSASLSGNRPQASLKAGSRRSVSRSSASG